MRPHSGVLIAFSLFAAVLFTVQWAWRSGTAQPIASDALFAARFVDAGGTMQPLAQWRGQVMVVNFWATWCPPCREEMPELSALQKKYRARGVVIVGISTDNAAKMQEFATGSPVGYPLLAADFDGVRLAESLGNTKGVLPYTVVLGRDGRVMSRHFGRVEAARLEQAITTLLR